MSLVSKACLYCARARVLVCVWGGGARICVCVHACARVCVTIEFMYDAITNNFLWLSTKL